ncbi:hypothetical protein OG455_27830 [Kitasatospora sp. NBC_01287]|uniref:hypothetical protein n=1 Tax=Kitasatospora sp. NBC_01287 TaxID=2903573 RepID=UPI00225599ED|nr:hypothetical protein [Kitasatospora sp. NBC_01287]MCX4749272.1 hypothetical protein [Kitasatospora sp. NBC_01287]
MLRDNDLLKHLRRNAVAISGPRHHHQAVLAAIVRHQELGPRAARAAYQLVDDATAIAWSQRTNDFTPVTYSQYRQLVRAAYYGDLFARAFDLGHADRVADLATEINTALHLDPQLTR